MGALAYTHEPWRITSERFDDMIAAGVVGPTDKLELLEGEIVPMSPIGDWHNYRTIRLSRVLERLFPAGFIGCDQHPLRIGDHSQPQPDVSIVRESEVREGKPRWAALVVEVADTTVRNDRRKAALYASGQIPEYWIVNRPDDVVEVHREPMPAPTSPTGFEYRSVQKLRRGESIQALQSTAPVTVDELLGEPSDLP